MTPEDFEDYAFYESGLGSDVCLENLDAYTRIAIQKYGRILLKNQKQLHDEEIKKYKEHLTRADNDYIKILSDYAKLDDNTRVEIQDLEAQLKTVEEQNELLERETTDTDLLKSQITLLYSILSKTDALWHQSEEKLRKLREISDKLYNTVLRMSPKSHSEASDVIKEYEELEKNDGL